MGFLGQLLSSQNNFQAQNPTAGQVSYNNAIGTNIATGAIPGVLNQQQQLAQTLQNQVNGGGPNLAATELQNATQNQNAQAAGLIGATRGMSPALAARQILNQQATNSQAASGQAAQTAEQQQLGAESQLGTVLGQQGNLATNQLGTLGQLQQGQNQIGLQSQQLQENAQLANQNAANSFIPGVGQLASGVGQTINGIANMNKGGVVDAMVSPGEMIIPPGGNYDDGGIVPGQAQVDGDSPKNDTVPVKLPVGAIVAPRSVTNNGSPSLDPKRVADFVNAFKNSSSPSGYAKVLAAKKKVQQAQ
jgi:hypothetical protein